MHKLVFDIETQNTFQEAGSADPAALSISLVGIYDYETDTYSSYLENELGKLWPIIEKADMLIGYNSDHFDIPLLNKYYPGDLTKIKSLDIMKEIKESCGRRIRLDSIAMGTFGKGKIGHGLEAITWWRNGEIEKIRKYCLEDVKITKELYEFASKNKKLICKEGTQSFEIKLDPSDWEQKVESAMTFSLPF
ncbi:MAG TPA: ribonuclease H-like domain-containing protein [Candidatus Paceibacterota bacterium]